MSQKLNLSFIQRPIFSLSSWTWLGVLFLISGLIALNFTWQMYQNKKNSYQTLLTKLHGQDIYKTNKVKVTTAKVSPEKIKQAQEAVRLLILPWNSLLEGIETSNIPNISLLSIVPSVKKQQVSLSGQAKNLETVFLYVKQLDDQPMLSQVYLQKHSIEEADVSKPVNFTILAKWQMSLEKLSNE